MAENFLDIAESNRDIENMVDALHCAYSSVDHAI